MLNKVRCPATLFVLGLACLPGGAAGPAAKAAGAEVLGLGALAPSGKVIFLPSAEGGVEAVALFNGKALWQAQGATQPLLATADKVFATAPIKGKRDRLKVVTFDAATGERLGESTPVVFPDWVSVRRDYGRHFRCAARLDNGDLLLIWQARAFSDGGGPPPDPDPQRKEAGGAVRVDAATGKVAPVKGYKPKAADFPRGLDWGNKAVLRGWTFTVKDKYPERAGPYTPTQRTLKAESADRKRSWTRRIAGEVDLPPRP
jgi:hypothetical protein